MPENAPYSGPIIDLTERYATTKERLLRLSYVSRRDENVTDDVMVNILLSAAVRNYLAGISSTLWASGCFFVQTMEGTMNVIEPFFRRICSDARHRDVTCVDRVRVEVRSFARPLAWQRIRNEAWSIVGVPLGSPEMGFDDACRLLMRRGAVTATR